MKLFNSRLATVAAAGVIVVLGGGATANAAGLLDGTDIQNESITGVDIDNGTLTGSDIKNQTLGTNDYAPQSVTEVSVANGSLEGRDVADESLTGADIANGSVSSSDLSAGLKDEIITTVKNSGQLDANGSLVAHAVVTNLDEMSTPYTTIAQLDTQALVSIDVHSTLGKPVKIEVAPGLYCIAVPVSGFDETECSATALVPSGTELGLAVPYGVTVSVAAVQVG